jgi:esterase/lipase superfamily enzyme
MSADLVVCVRNVTRDRRGRKVYGSEPGPTHYLGLTTGADSLPDPEDATQRMTATEWASAAIDASGRREPTEQDPDGHPGDILVFVHGYNNSQADVMQRHRMLRQTLAQASYAGAVVTFDWPSANKPLNYLEDRDDAEATAKRLRDHLIKLLCGQQARGCTVNVHLLCHSTGAYVIRHAFYDADKSDRLRNQPWRVSQIALIGADVSQRSMRESDPRSKSIYRHCARLTNYQNPYDGVLKLSNTKRIGLAPRAGRVGLPDGASPKAVDVDCGQHFRQLDRSQANYTGSWSHSWHIGDPVFTRDLSYVLAGDIDRRSIPTRARTDDGLILRS